MAIIWYSEARAETEFAATLSDWATNYGYKGCHSADETREAIAETEDWARYSVTARKLMHFVTRSSKSIIVVGMKGGYQCFDSTAGIDSNLATIFVDLGGKLTVNVRGPHNLHFEPNLCTGKVEALDNRVALLHEFGHAKQWIERPSMFDNKKSAAGTPKWGGAAQKSGGGPSNARIDKATFRTDIREKAMEMRARRDKVEGNLDKVGKLPYKKVDIFPSAEETAQFQAPAWGPAIEMDNMARHEWPICNEMGLPKRANYRDINCTSDSSPSLTSMIRIKIAEQIAKERAAQEAKDKERERMEKAKGTQLKCKYCDKVFRNEMMRTGHQKLVHPGLDD